MTGDTGDTWVAASGLDVVEDGERLVVRHRALTDGNHLGVRIKAASWVPDLLEFLGTSRTGAQVAERFPSPSLNTVLTHLHRNGVIFRDRRDEETFLLHGAATVLARQAMRAASASRVIGPDLPDHASAERLLAEARELCARLTELSDELDTAVAAFTADQVSTLGTTGLKLHLGCGGNLVPTWVNMDIVAGDVRADLRRGLPFPDGCARYVYSCHMLEHLSYPDEALPLLREIHRVLQPGGVVRIVVPDIEPCLRAYASNDQEFFAERARYWTWADPAGTRLSQFLAYAGANRDPFDLIGHKYGYDFETLADLLGRAGLGAVRRSTHQASEHADLRVDDWSEAASFTVRGEHLSLFVEASRGE